MHDDALGRFYARSMAENGTDFVNQPVKGGDLPTSRSMIFVSPDGERSMNTYLGISSELGPEDVSDSVAGGPRSCSSRAISTTSPRENRPSSAR